MQEARPASVKDDLEIADALVDGYLLVGFLATVFGVEIGELLGRFGAIPGLVTLLGIGFGRTQILCLPATAVQPVCCCRQRWGETHSRCWKAR